MADRATAPPSRPLEAAPWKRVAMIVTNVDNFYVTDDKIINSPSRERGVSEEDEFAMRVHGCELVQEAAVLLKASQQVACTGQVLLHRFYAKR